jgi:hypothetical protein
MIDLWEMMGLLVMDRKFQKKVFAFPKRRYSMGKNQRSRIPVGPTAKHPNDPNDYELLRKIVGPHLPNTPLSLMGLGEMLFSLTSKDFRDKACLVAEAIKEMDLDQPEDGTFYMALGAMITDPQLIVELLTNKNWRKFGFESVTRNDRKMLIEIVNQNYNPTVYGLIHDFCYTLWGSECNDSIIAWDAHTHPVALPTGVLR